MQRRNQWMVALLIVAGLQASACAAKPAASTAEKPAHVDAIEGSSLKSVTLTEKARERLALETTTVQEVQMSRKRRVGGEVVVAPGTMAADAASSAAAGDGSVWVRVRLNESDRSLIDSSQPTRVLPLDSDDGEDADEMGVEAEADEGVADDAEEATGVKPLYYAVRAKDHGLKVGQRMLVELTLKGSDGPHKAVPYSAVIYDIKGDTWVYTNPEGLMFVRAPIVIDFIDGETAFLADGPDTGTTVVTNGAAELYGAETGVGK
jgi:hypothetical protein